MSMQVYKEEEYLQLAGIQHFAFCKRQWGLIHLEQVWKENVRTIEGTKLHEVAHDEQFIEKRGNVLITRGLEVSSHELGIYGICDVVEFHKDEQGALLQHYDGTWQPMPVEYKRGIPKVEDVDRLQVCAQVICLEEIFNCSISEGALYYNETKHRETIIIDDALRKKVQSIVDEMHQCYSKGCTPKGKTGKQCFACSMYDLCLPNLNDAYDVKAYIKAYIGEVNEKIK